MKCQTMNFYETQSLRNFKYSIKYFENCGKCKKTGSLPGSEILKEITQNASKTVLLSVPTLCGCWQSLGYIQIYTNKLLCEKSL